MMNRIERLRYRSIGFSGTCTLIASVLGQIVTISILLNLPWWIPLKITGIVALYAIIGLIAEDLKGIEDLANNLWEMSSQKTGMTPEQQQSLIFSQIESCAEQYTFLWILFDKIAHGNETYQTRMDLIKALIKKIPNGQLNIFQIIYIYAYFIYSIAWYEYTLSIDPIVDALVIIGVLILLLISSSKIIGIGKFFTKIIKASLPASEQDLLYQLRILRNLLIQGNHIYFFLDLKKEKQEQ